MNLLTEVQLKAVVHTEGPLVIFAGAGSGKTRVITHRIAYLIENNLALPEEICAVTFTNKAAAEMLERTAKIIPDFSKRIIIRTFHSLCNYILRRESVKVGFPAFFTIYDMQMQESLIKEILKKHSYDTKLFKPISLVSKFSYIKDSLNDISEYSLSPFTENGENFTIKNIIFNEYENLKKERNAMDYGDLILNTVKLFTQYPEILKKYSTRWKYIMVDEYQDTNRMQNELIRLLASGFGNVCVVGDDDQMIYSWRGADAGNILSFAEKFSLTKVIKLEENFRSTAKIINTAATLINHNLIRKEKTLFTNNPEGNPVSYSIYENEHDEAYQVVQEIYKLIRSGSDLKEIAVFYRTNSSSRVFEESLNRLNIPYKIFGGFKFYDRAEIKDIIAYLTVIVNPEDSTSLLRIINIPARGIGDVTIEKLLQFSRNENLALLNTFTSGKLTASAKVKNNLMKLFSILNELIVIKNEIMPTELTERLLAKSGLMENYSFQEDYENRLENIHEFIQSIKEYENNTENPSLAEYLANITLMTGGDEEDEQTQFVSLMTVHNAKGLEFENVFLTGMDEGIFPHSMSMNSNDEIEEERRLGYVAITRAKKTLFISSRIFLKRMNQYMSPSRFINEIQEHLQSISNKRQRTEYTSSKSYFNPDQISSYNMNTIKTRPDAQGSIKSDAKAHSIKKNDSTKFKIGDIIKHNAYGNGKIIEISGNGQNMKVRIKFGAIEKNFFLAYTPLEILE